MKDLTCAIIVTYKPKLSDLTLLLDSLCEQVNAVYVVDNSAQHLVDDFHTVCDKYENVNKLLLTGNFGIGFAQNFGVKVASKEGYKYCLFFDQDSVLDSNMVGVIFSSYSKLIEDGCRVGALGPIVIDERSKKMFPFFTYSGFRRKVISCNDFNGDLIPTFHLISSGTFFSIDVWNDVGGNNEDFFIEYVDSEWCLRAVSKGYSIYGCKGAILSHKLGDDRRMLFGRFEIPMHAAYRYYFVFRNGIYCSFRGYIPIAWRLYNVIRLVALYFLVLCVHKEKIKFSKFVFLGLIDAVMNNFHRKIL